jgi:REP element-mobilizing transposase RayT
MKFDPEKHHRRSIRFAGYDYRTSGGYFVTICTAKKRCVFGTIENGAMRLHPYGRMAETCWHALPEHFPNVVLDEFVVMPNHIHGIMIFQESQHVGAQHAAPLQNVASGSLGAIVRSFKSAVTRAINIHRAERNLAPVHVWQRNFYDRIIRDEKELNDTQRYIIENPQHWETDKNHPMARPTNCL